MPDKETVLNILSVTPVEGSSGKRGRKNELMYLKAGVPYRYMCSYIVDSEPIVYFSM